jgi:hypothetical protein
MVFGVLQNLQAPCTIFSFSGQVRKPKKLLFSSRRRRDRNFETFNYLIKQAPTKIEAEAMRWPMSKRTMIIIWRPIIPGSLVDPN